MSATPQELYHRARELGLRLEPKGDKLAVSPADRVPPDFAEVLRENKPALLEWLSNPPRPGWRAVPPDNLALDPVKPCPMPEDRERVMHFLLRQTMGRPPGPLAAWIVRRENDYYAGPGRKWDCALICFAACRDGVCWQLQRSQADVLTTLAAFDEGS